MRSLFIRSSKFCNLIIGCSLIAALILYSVITIPNINADLGGHYALSTKWGTHGTGNGQFNQPYGVAVDSSGRVYVADSANNRIQKFSSSGNFITKWGTQGSGNGEFKSPYGIAVDSSNNVYVADSANNRI